MAVRFSIAVSVSFIAFLLSATAVGSSLTKRIWPTVEKGPYPSMVLNQGQYWNQSPFERLNGGAKPLSGDEISRALEKVVGKKRFTEQLTDGGQIEWTLVRTGTGKDGRHRGYISSVLREPITGVRVSQRHGADTSWAQVLTGEGRLVMVTIHHRPKQRADGSTIPAGTQVTTSREVMGSSSRITETTSYPNGLKQLRVSTKHGDGSSERYLLTGSGEELVRRAADGSWQTTVKFLKRDDLVLETTRDSSGRKKVRRIQLNNKMGNRITQMGNWLSKPLTNNGRFGTGARRRRRSNNLQRALTRFLRGGDVVKETSIDPSGKPQELKYNQNNRLGDLYRGKRIRPKQVLIQYKDKGWRWKEELPIHFFPQVVGEVSASGKGGRLGVLTSSLLSPFGTRFGKTKQVVGPTAKPAKRNNPIAKKRTYYRGVFLPVEAQKKLDVEPTDRAHLQSVVRTINEHRPKGTPEISARVDSASTGNAFAPILGGDILVGPDIVRAGEVVATVAHEAGHQTALGIKLAKRAYLMKQYASGLDAIGHKLGYSVATLLGSDVGRKGERIADHQRGTILGRLHNAGKKVSSDDLNAPTMKKVLPHWTPYVPYDRRRGPAIKKAFGRTVRSQRR